jgi:DNA-binding NarL/FixJ family response regulator
VRVFHCDDSDAYRRLTELSLAGRDDIEVVGGAGDRAAALAGIGHAQPDIVLLDAIAPDFGTDLVADILEAAPSARVIVLSGLAGARAEDERISAHVTKDASFEELEDVLRHVADTR